MRSIGDNGITGAKKECSPFSRRGGAEDREEFKVVLQRQKAKWMW
jgi:hypothetical protein